MVLMIILLDSIRRCRKASIARAPDLAPSAPPNLLSRARYKE